MSLSNVLKGMKEGFPKDQVVDDLNILRQDLATYTIPMFQQAEKDFGTRTFKSKYAENFHKHLKVSLQYNQGSQKYNLHQKYLLFLAPLSMIYLEL